MMERIKKALELAEAARATGSAEPAHAPPPATMPHAGLAHERPAHAARAAAPEVRGLRLESIAVRPVSAAVTARNRLIDVRGRDPGVAAYKMLRTQVLQRMREHGWHRLAIVSPGASDGKTVTALNLGAAISMEGRHPVAVVDFDLRRPRLHECFGVTPSAGIDAVLRGRADPADVWFRPSTCPDMVIVPGIGSVADSSELLSGPGPAELIRRLREVDERILVIMDLPPVLGADDALAVAPNADCALLVACQGHTAREDISRSLDLLRQVPIVGTVLNASRDSVRRYY
jgi:Mrp family chromosome partitioning ATPase